MTEPDEEKTFFLDRLSHKAKMFLHHMHVEMLDSDGEQIPLPLLVEKAISHSWHAYMNKPWTPGDEPAPGILTMEGQFIRYSFSEDVRKRLGDIRHAWIECGGGADTSITEIIEEAIDLYWGGWMLKMYTQLYGLETETAEDIENAGKWMDEVESTLLYGEEPDKEEGFWEQ